MQTAKPSAFPVELDELGTLQLQIARRADELARADAGRHPDRNFWLEAEQEIWSGSFAPARSFPPMRHS